MSIPLDEVCDLCGNHIDDCECEEPEDDEDETEEL